MGLDPPYLADPRHQLQRFSGYVDEFPELNAVSDALRPLRLKASGRQGQLVPAKGRLVLMPGGLVDPRGFEPLTF